MQELLSNPENVPTKDQKPLLPNTTQTASYLESVEYSQEGLTPYEIAIERGISESTVLNHLTQAAEEGELEEFDADVAGSKKQLIKKAFQKVGTEALRPVKEFLGEEVSYEDIKYVLIEYLVKDC